jgi:hypothetical protein
MSAVTNNNEDADTKYAALVQAHYDAENDAIVADEVGQRVLSVDSPRHRRMR